MDVIEASHFERLKQFLVKYPGFEFKCRKQGSWHLAIRWASDGELYQSFSDTSFGEALKNLSHWIGEHNAIPIRATKALSLGKTSSNSAPLGEEVRQ